MDDPPVPHLGPPVAVKVVQNPIEAESLKAVLESYGIPVMLKSPTVTHTMLRGINAGPISDISLMVPGERSGEAADLLRTLEEGNLGEDAPG